MMPLQRHIKNVVRNYTDAERKVREATSNDPWGPKSTLMSEIADRTYNVIAFTEIMQMIWRRLNDKSKNWRHVFKALVLLEYIIKTGSDKVAIQCRENIHAIETLMDFYHVEDGKDVGSGVRDKARSLNALLRDEERLQEERTKALLARERLMQVAVGSGGISGGGIVASSSIATYSPPSRQSSALGRSNSVSIGIDPRRPSSQPSFSGGIPSELGSAQPLSYTEEQLQLRLALAISREEHERELQKRHEEEAKEALKLQMVLEQSKRDEQNRAAVASALLLTEPASTNTAGGGLFSLIDTSLSVAPANVPDPWSVIAPSPPTQPQPTSHPSAILAAPSPLDSNQQQQLSLVHDSPWIPKDDVVTRTDAAPTATAVSSKNNPWAALDPLAPTAAAPSQNGNGATAAANSCPFGPSADTSSTDVAAASSGAVVAVPRKRTPADFLGNHKDLVDLEKLVDRNPSSTNPFATSLRPATGHPTNPFCVNTPPKPSLNQLSSQSMAPPLALMGATASTSATTFPGQFPSQDQHLMMFQQAAGPSSSSAQQQHPQASSLNPFF